MLQYGSKTNKTLLQFVATSTSIATGTALTLKDLAGNTLTLGSTDVLVITAMAVGDAAGAGGTFQLQTADSQPVLVVVGAAVGGGGIALLALPIPIQLPVGKSLKYVGTANGFVNVHGFIER